MQQYSGMERAVRLLGEQLVPQDPVSREMPIKLPINTTVIL
ncbi:MAG: hypothetical protein UHX00_04190 [Caryophanon sp.]|nr:hypothetical protein [Caryophanon sp.]